MLATTALLLAAKIAEEYSKNDNGDGSQISNEIKFFVSERTPVMEKFVENLTGKISKPLEKNEDFKSYPLNSIFRALAETPFID